MTREESASSNPEIRAAFDLGYEAAAKHRDRVIARLLDGWEPVRDGRWWRRPDDYEPMSDGEAAIIRAHQEKP
jgi:hypothetical protein